MALDEHGFTFILHPAASEPVVYYTCAVDTCAVVCFYLQLKASGFSIPDNVLRCWRGGYLDNSRNSRNSLLRLL